MAGVGGRLRDTTLHSAADKRRAMHLCLRAWRTGRRRLGGGGLHRRSAVDATGYLANRWLLACEEAELGARRGRRGWGLVRLGAGRGAYGAPGKFSSMLKRLWRNGRMRACCAPLRGAVGQPWFAANARARHVPIVRPPTA